MEKELLTWGASADITPGTSIYTLQKYRDVDELFGLHMKIVKGIYGTSSVLPYVYYDMNCSWPTVKLLDGKEHESSAIKALRHLIAKQLPSQVVLVDQNPIMVNEFKSYLSMGGDGLEEFIHCVYCGDNRSLILKKCDDVPTRAMGLLFHDGYGIPDYETLHKVFTKQNMRTIDLLLYAGATPEKRQRGRNQDEEFFHLKQALISIGKQYWVVREPHGRNQWTFLIGSNWEKFPEWQSRGFYRIESEQGKRIIQRLIESGKQKQEDSGDDEESDGIQGTLFKL